MKQKLKNKENKLVWRIAIKAILRWLMFKALAICIVAYSATGFWNESLTLAQKIVSIIIGAWIATMLFLGSRFDDILDDVIMSSNIKRK